MLPVAFLFVLFSLPHTFARPSGSCHSAPGDPSFPTSHQLSQLNSSIGGRLISVVPSAKFCNTRAGGCTPDQWVSDIFRADIPGAMENINWEQDYSANPPSLCFLETAACGQGTVPLYAVNATQPQHIQAGLAFARSHNLKVTVKSSGHDYLGRSTSKNSFLLWTHYMRDLRFTDNFKVGNASMGSAVTVGSGVAMRDLYLGAKAHGKIVVGGTAQNVAPAGGYVQGGGHSAVSPLFGLAADNALEFKIVLANGDFVTANAVSHPDLFWALRGGGPGSWGVIISATFRTYPTFNVVIHEVFVGLNSSSDAAENAFIHASHIFDWDALHTSQYSFVLPTPAGRVWYLLTVFPNMTIDAANAAMTPYLDAVRQGGFTIQSTDANSTLINDQLATPTFFDSEGNNQILGSRFIPADVYRNNPAAFRDAYLKLVSTMSPSDILMGFGVAGGRVSQNANISNAVNPAWRTAKTQIVLFTGWDDNTPATTVASIRADLTHNKVPILEALSGGNAAYMNEADVLEPSFQTAFYGPNYPRLSSIKRQYDPQDVFIVPTGVGSERWDAAGFCTV